MDADLHERVKLLEEALRRTSACLDLALRTAHAGVWEWELASNRVCWSPHMAELIGKQGEMRGGFGDLSGFVHPDERDRLRTELQSVAAGGTRLETEFRLGNSGEYRRMCAVVEVLRDPDGRPERVIGIVLDVTTRRALEDRVRQDQRVAHDLGNLLSVVAASTALLRRHPPAEDLYQLSIVMGEACRQGAGLTQQLIASVHHETSAPEAVDLNRLVLEEEPLLRRLAGSRVRMTLRLDTSIPKVWADPAELVAGLTGLVRNACDAMPDGGRLTISTVVAGRDVVLTVAGDGDGDPCGLVLPTSPSAT